MAWHRHIASTICLGLFTSALNTTLIASDSASEPQVLLVVGAQGEPEYGTIFKAAADRWKRAFGESVVTLLDGTGLAEEESEENESAEKGDDVSGSHREQILDWIQSQNAQTIPTATDGTSKEQAVNQPRWIIFIGHGTSDRTGSKFNLAGPDLSAKELASALKGSSHEWVIINCFSSSGPFLAELSGENRIVITATKSGSEQNYSRFADYFSRALTDPRSDLDHDDQISVLEAFLAASSGVARFYQDEGRLASEQALLDDNGDKRGTPALFFRGLRAVKAPSDGLRLDGDFARRVIIARLGESPGLPPEMVAQAQEIEARIERLRKQKGQLDGDEYANQLESLLLQLAEILIVD
ncbi:hypothetical protein SH449x_001474 [Pirellulaceae bacterium SH449]